MPLIIQKKNNYILGIPIGAKLYQSGNKNSDSLINLWLNKKENREKKLNTIFSKKQVSQIKKYVKDFNNWKTRNGEKLEIVDSLKTIFSVENIKSFYRNRGYFDSKVKSEVVVDKNQKNYGNVIYNVNLGNRYLLDSIKLNIKSKLLDSIFNSKKEKSLLVMGDPFTTSIFEKERNRIDKLFKDSGIYNFQISAISYKVNLDTISANFRVPVEILIDDKKNNDYKIHKIEKINIKIVNEDLDTELEFIENFNGIDFYSNDILNYKTKILTELISIKINSNYSDEARTNTIKKLNDFTIGKILKAEKHPDADKLRVCKVDTDNGEVQIICGAPNAIEGILVVVAKPGVYVPGIDTTIGVGKIRGIESHGMMCSEREMELSDEHDGIIELPLGDVGEPYGNWLLKNESDKVDAVVEIAITPNRPDALGVRGIARDLAARGLGTLKPMEVRPIPGKFECPISVSIEPDTLVNAPVFYGRLIRGVKNGPSPKWLQNRLRAIGLRPISTLVDITNFFTYDTNRPLHVLTQIS